MDYATIGLRREHALFEGRQDYERRVEHLEQHRVRGGRLGEA